MENLKEIRWKQRFTNLAKAFTLYNEGVSSAATLNRLEKEGLIQRFEYTFELSWKTLKDYLESKGIAIAYPRDVLKEAFAHELIIDGETWMTMLDHRNLMSHTYDEERFNEVFSYVVGKNFEVIKALYDKLKSEL
jgi:nucleotidyltransferase substrate binding protein (TIGR01987 family)